LQAETIAKPEEKLTLAIKINEFLTPYFNDTSFAVCSDSISD